ELAVRQERESGQLLLAGAAGRNENVDEGAGGPVVAEDRTAARDVEVAVRPDRHPRAGAVDDRVRRGDEVGQAGVAGGGEAGEGVCAGRGRSEGWRWPRRGSPAGRGPGDGAASSGARWPRSSRRTRPWRR